MTMSAVIHTTLSLAQAKAEIPLLLGGKLLPPHTSSSELRIGSQNFDRPPVAIAIGASIGEDAVRQMREACAGVNRGVPWLHADWNLAGKGSAGISYGESISARLKARLRELEAEGKMGRDGYYRY